MAPTPGSSTPSERRVNTRPSALACTECRRKHLKCDTLSPPCTRCTERGLLCKYTPSRRGHRSAANTSLSAASTGLAESACGSTTLSAPPLQVPSTGTVASTSFANSNLGSVQADIASLQSQATGAGSLQQSDASPSSQTLMGPEEEHWTNLYYLHFHATHPVLLPRNRYSAHPYPHHLRLVVQLIGSQYSTTLSNGALKAATDAAVAALAERSAYAVQSLLLYSIMIFAGGERGKAVRTLTKASALAIELGLNQADFASRHSMQDALFEESLRRTWWELYVVDGYCAALHRDAGFRCNTVRLNAPLPCEEMAYREGSPCSQATTLGQLDARFFVDAEQPFASACYRIEAIRIIGRVLPVINGEDITPDDIQAVDNAIAAWKSHLPLAKAGVIDPCGEVDQMMFQAHAFIHMASMLLHFPRSELPLTLPIAVDIACASRMAQASPTCAQHAVKAIAASKDLSDLAALPVDKHSPLFICGLVLGSLVQLAACLAHSYDCNMQHRDRVALMTGLLKGLGRHWVIASDVLQPINKIASGTIGATPALESTSSPSQHDSGLGMDAMLDDVSWLDFFPVDDIGGPDTFIGETWPTT